MLLGIDLGSTSIKACAFEERGRLISQAAVPTQLSHEMAPDGARYAYWDPDIIWRDTAAAIRGALSQLPATVQIDAAAVSSMGMDAVPLDACGKPLYPFISWHCKRTLKQYGEIEAQLGRERIYQVTGQQMSPIHTACRLLWLKQHRPELYGRTSKWLLMSDYINYRLSGTMATEPTMASTTALYDQARAGWSEDFIRELELNPDALPDVAACGTDLGAVTPAASAETGLPTSCRVVLGAHDYICGMLPVGAHRPGSVLSIAGTWEMVLAACTGGVDPSGYRGGFKTDAHAASGTLCMVADAVASDMLTWFMGTLGTRSMDALIQACQAKPDPSKLLFLPHFYGASAPEPDALSLGAFVGLNGSAAPETLYKAVIEGLNYQFRDMLTAVTEASGLSPDTICLLGGLARNPIFVQAKADICGKAVSVPEIEEATALGAALLSGVGAGIYRDLDDAAAQMAYQQRVVEPNGACRAQYEALYGLYRTVYPALKPVHHALNGL